MDIRLLAKMGLSRAGCLEHNHIDLSTLQMNSLQKINRLDLLAGTALIVLTIFTLGLIVYINWLGISVNLQTTNPRDQISPHEVLTLTFSLPMKPSAVENALRLQPNISGRLEWEDERTVHFIPTQPYLGNLVVSLTRGQLGMTGEWLRHDTSWDLTVRQPQIVYINHAEPKSELMTTTVTGETSHQLTFTNGKVFDFSVSPSGDTIAYILVNDQRGFDLWLINRNGENPRRLIDSGRGHCLSPVWSPDGTSIAYSRQTAGLQPTDPLGAPRLWVINVQSGENHAVFSDSQIIGYGALWSPDGNWLSTFDGIADQMHFIHLKSGQQVSIPSSLGSLGSWSPDSRFLIYPDQTLGVNNVLKTYLYQADFQTGETSIFLGKGSDTTDYFYGNPAWSPDGKNIVFSLRINPGKADGQLWLMNVESLGGPTIAQGDGFSYSSYSWDPWGIGVVMQQINLKKSYTPEMAIWYPSQGLQILPMNGIFPHWLP